jgi:hypothetical protein
MDYEILLKKHNDAIKYISLLEEENSRLKTELADIKKNDFVEEIYENKLDQELIKVKENKPEYAKINNASSNKEKIDLYLSLFIGREDICAKRWENNKTGRYGYGPYCKNDWIQGICGKYNKIKCSKCKNQDFYKLNDITLRDHLKGKETLGIYPIDIEDMCYDFLIKGGFGNLIALPLQKKPRDNGNSVFVDENFNVIEDQWKCLAEISKIQKEEIDGFLEEQSNVKTLDVDIMSGKPILVNKTDYSSNMKLILQNGIIISKKHISSKGVVFLRRLGSYLNPEFYSKQAMRMSTYNTPRMTVLYEENESEIILPIGVLSDLKKAMNDIGVNFTVIDERTEGQLIDVSFDGVLRSDQLEAFETIKEHDNGVLSATTGFGKTVLGAKLIAEKKVSTLVLVHTKELALQWLERLEQFLDIKYEVKVPLTPKGRKKKLMLVGQLGGGKKQLTGKIDVALMQSMFKRDKSVKEMIDDYGMIIVDECHHVG